jgi:hypothetical protein
MSAKGYVDHTYSGYDTQVKSLYDDFLPATLRRKARPTARLM